MLEAIAEGFRFVRKRIDIEYKTRIREGKSKNEVYSRWQTEGVGHTGKPDANHIGGMLALLSKPYKASSLLLLDEAERPRNIEYF